MRQEVDVAMRLLDSVAPFLTLAPVPGLLVAWKGFKALWDLVQQVHEGRSQLEVLSASIAVFLSALDQKLHDNEHLAASIEENLKSLLSLVEEISEFAWKQTNKPFLKRLLQGEEVTSTVTKYHQRLLHVYNAFNLSCELDIKLWQSQFEDARRHDQEVLEGLLQELMKNQDRLFKELFGKIDVQQTTMLAAMSAMQKSIIRLNTNTHRSTERHFLQHSVSILQRKSGHVVKTESWTTSSFEVDKGEKLGSGGFSTVYKATYLGAPIAVKELAPSTSSKMLMNEIAVWEGLRHPNILQFMGASVYEDPPFIIMELMIKGNALDFIHDKPTANRVLLIHQISLGLVYLHTRNTIHGDLKATNVLIRADETAVIADFGLSMIKLDVTSRSTTVLVSGTKRWMSPERMKGKQLATPVDIYAWAMTAYEIFTGLVPFGPTDESLLYELVVRERERPERPDSGTAEVGLTDAIWLLMERSWAPDPSQRPSASDVRDETARFIASPLSDPVAELPSPDVEPTLSVTYSSNDNSTILPRQSLAAVSVGESLLLYVQNDLGVIHEFRCDGSPAEVVRGRFNSGPSRWLNKFSAKTVRGCKYSITSNETLRSVPGSGIAAFGWLNQPPYGGLFIRLYIQEPSYALRELCSEVQFQDGMLEPAEGLPESSIAAVTSPDGPPFDVFYQAADGAIYGKIYGKSRRDWKPVRRVVRDAMPRTALSVVSTNDLKKLRLYYQENDSTVREQQLDREIWTPGFKFPISTPTSTRIATVAWNDQAEIRLFIQDHRMDIIEWAYHSTAGWEPTNFRTPGLQFTDIAATVVMLKNKPHIWLYFHSPNGILQQRICFEDDGVMKWTDADDVI